MLLYVQIYNIAEKSYLHCFFLHLLFECTGRIGRRIENMTDDIDMSKMGDIVYCLQCQDS